MSQSAPWVAACRARAISASANPMSLTMSRAPLSRANMPGGGVREALATLGAIVGLWCIGGRRCPAAVELSARKAPAAGRRLGLLHGTHALAIGIENPLAVNRRTTIPWVSFEDPPFHRGDVTKQSVGHSLRRVLIDVNSVAHVRSLGVIVFQE
jgi:hypothetical protein